MRLDVFLVTHGYCESRQEAQEAIKNGNVTVDGVVVTKASKETKEGASLLYHKKRKYVSRGGDKLESAFLARHADIHAVRTVLHNKQALDIGSSTGGFSDFLLQHGISHVDAVDVGTSQLHPSLKAKNGLTLYENQDIRTFATDRHYDVIVADLSFIPLEKILEKVISFGTAGTDFVLLIKPQFEVGKGNTKKGIVKDKTLVVAVLEKYTKLLKEYGINHVQVIESGVLGGDGNQEYFLYFTMP
jgi:23S rRNA (cytidine1920-2'-O)/16S rRNA (cytidine1409-2'-O)-methyltransferase